LINSTLGELKISTNTEGEAVLVFRIPDGTKLLFDSSFSPKEVVQHVLLNYFTKSELASHLSQYLSFGDPDSDENDGPETEVDELL